MMPHISWRKPAFAPRAKAKAFMYGLHALRSVRARTVRFAIKLRGRVEAQAVASLDWEAAPAVSYCELGAGWRGGGASGQFCGRPALA